MSAKGGERVYGMERTTEKKRSFFFCSLVNRKQSIRKYHERAHTHKIRESEKFRFEIEFGE